MSVICNISGILLRPCGVQYSQAEAWPQLPTDLQQRLAASADGSTLADWCVICPGARLTKT